MSEPYPFVSCGQHFSEEFGFRYADHQRSCLVEKQQSEIQRGRCQVFGLKGSASDYHCDTNHNICIYIYVYIYIYIHKYIYIYA